eukprot:TRINITY_DN3970_c0_g1_i2.p1 TRINITY_DN3970_c0_g1~~TRINITY_DN3970_c0_g1_i2.p1  ORF type:complete len:458 (+),score=25.92 TRINITY_DN3970_c0_g1_i2:683-2056(+)
MQKKEVPYGCFFAQDYIVKCTSQYRDEYFDWDSLEILDENFKLLHSIERKNKTPPRKMGKWGMIYPPEEIVHLYVNQLAGENSIILANVCRNYNIDEVEGKMIIEVYELATGNLTLEMTIEAKYILGYYGTTVIIVQQEQAIAFDLNTKEKMTLSSDYKNAVICIHNNKIGVTENLKIKFFSLSPFEELNELNVEPIFKELNLHIHIAERNRFAPPAIQAIAFDDSKLIINCALFNSNGTSNSIAHFVLYMASGALINSMHNTYDGAFRATERSQGVLPRIHLAPGGKIITDSHNLTVYDFTHPNADPEIKVPVIYIKNDTAQKTNVKLMELSKFATERLNVHFDQLKIRSLNIKRGNKQFRVTMIYGNVSSDSRNDIFAEAFKNWEPDQLRRSAWLLTSNPNPNSFCEDKLQSSEEMFQVGKIQEAVLVFEQFKPKNDRWEFCEPMVENLVAMKKK